MTNSEDALLQCLLTLCRFHAVGTAEAAIYAGLPLRDGKLTPVLFERAAGRVGLASRIVYRTITDIEPALLPAVVILKGERACLLTGWDESGEIAHIVYSAHNEAVVNVPREQLLDDASGEVILCRPRFRFDSRAPRVGTSVRGHWFWDAIRANAPIYRDVLLAAFFI